MELGLRNKSVLITGSSRGLGQIIAESYLREGARVCLVARDDERLNKVRDRLSAEFGSPSVFAISTDLTSDDGVKRCVDFLKAAWGSIDIAVANVGGPFGRPGAEILADDWRRSLDVNLMYPALLMQSLHELLRTAQGNIVFVSSIAGKEAIRSPVPYSAAKLGLTSVLKHYARAFATDGIRVNMISPGNILFPDGLWERRLAENRQAVMDYIAEEVPLKRFASGEEVADAILFLSSQRASFITGADLVVDGGQTRGFT